MFRCTATINKIICEGLFHWQTNVTLILEKKEEIQYLVDNSRYGCFKGEVFSTI